MEEKKINRLLITVIIGLFIAGAAFLITFISTQKASEQTNKYKNIKTVKIVEPSPATIPALKGSQNLPSTSSASASIRPILPSVAPSTTVSGNLSSPSSGLTP